MSYLYVCNTSSDYISKINLEDFKEEAKLNFKNGKIGRIGPHGICFCNNKLVVANSFNNSLSVFNNEKNEEEECYYIGIHCNDVAVYEDKAFIVCGELNNVVVFNLNKGKIIEEIPCGSFPHSININKEHNLLAIANMTSDDIAVIDCKNREHIKNIKVGSYPTKVTFTEDGKYLLVCESNIGINSKGSISIIDIKNNNLVNKIKVGNSPIDFCIEEDKCFVTNFGDGTVSIVDIKKCEEIRRVKVLGMPRGILKKDNYIYIGDSYNNRLIEIDLINGKRKVISIGKEPTAMTLV